MILHKIAENFYLKELRTLPSSDKIIHIEGLSRGAKAPFIAGLLKNKKRQILVISEDAAILADDLSLYVGAEDVKHFPSWDTFPTEDISPSKELVGERLKVLDRISKNGPLIVTSKIKASVTRTILKEDLKNYKITLVKGKGISRDDLNERLVRLGYKRREMAGESGEFAVRGSLVDIFAPHIDKPVRIEYLGDNIESIKYFEAETQRSTGFAESAVIYPINEVIVDDPTDYCDGIEQKMPILQSEFHTICEHMSDNSIIVLDEPTTLDISCKRFIKEVEELRRGFDGKFYISFDEMDLICSTKQRMIIGTDNKAINITVNDPKETHGKLDQLHDLLISTRGIKYTVIVSKQADRLNEFLQEKGVPCNKVETELVINKNMPCIVTGELSRGFESSDTLILADRDIFGLLPQKARFITKQREGISKEMLADMSDGDLIVHENYGVGLFRGLKKLDIGNATQEYIQVDYADGDVLYVPLSQMGLVERYSGSADSSPKLNKLGGVEWLKTKVKAKNSIKDMTAELLNIYAERNKQQGTIYPPDTVWQMEFEKAFPYEETPDQEKAIRQIKRELESGRLIDRLVCGDVGYGKTEVAIRAAFKVATSGKQVAVLCPTTVLADQHYRTFSQRFGTFPMTVELLSRFRSKEEQKNVADLLSKGEVNVVIGTHRLLSKDIKFKDLGLIIVDEEQKFGVTHKERLKKIAAGVNIITLSATPIPRTLYMSMSGVKEMSLISTPPLDRSPVRTYLREWNEDTIKEVLLRELERGGQVFFVHNFVKTIDKTAAMIQKLIPDARVGVGHGQMKESELEDVMIKFIDRKYDVLVSTSIIESGLDIPSVNTVIIDHAENFGLSQLYQIRGRVGRSSTRAFAYLLYHKDKVLSEIALERLKAIQEFTSLGSGYKLAMADLEIRGAGNLLGSQQSGHLLNIGFDMYCQLLEESVREIKGTITPASRQVYMDLKVDAFLPDDYVTDEKQRIALYRRLNFLNTIKELEDIKLELIDRFGVIPPEVITLAKIVELKILAASKGIISIVGGDDTVFIKYGINKTLKIPTKTMTQGKWFELVQKEVSKLPTRTL